MTPNPCDLLTIVVPTYNRYPLLRRLLSYYQSVGAPMAMHVLDSSSQALSDPPLEALLRDMARLHHTTYAPDTLPTAKLHDGLQRVTTPYVVLWADDDLMVPRSFEAGVQFLERHPDFSLAHGRGGLFTTSQRQASITIGPYRQRAYLDETAAGRLTQYLTDATGLFYSVHRTENLRHNLGQCRRYHLGFPAGQHAEAEVHRSDVWVELLLASLSVIQGKAQQLDRLYILRDSHPGMNSWEDTGAVMDMFDWITSTSFHETYASVAMCLSKSLAQHDGLTLDRARAIVKQGLWSCLVSMLSRNWRVRYANGHASHRLRWREATRQIPGLSHIWRRIRSSLPGQELSLERLHQPRSPYYADFLPLYDALIGADGHADLVHSHD